MARLQRKDVGRPDETRIVSKGVIRMYDVGDSPVSYQVFEPGWRWSESVKPLAGTEWCEYHHLGFSISGRARIQLRDGAEIEIGPQQFFEVPPQHDGWVVGDEPWVQLEWGPASAFAEPAGGSVERLIASLLFTDIVDSTAIARRLGDARWRDQLARHNQLIRAQLDRFRGREITTTGDGFVCLFDSAERAVHAALAMASATPSIGLAVRCGIHTGEVEIQGGDVHGLAAHVAARVMSVAGPGEVLVSWTTRDLLAGSKLSFEDRGTHELKGLPEPRPIYAVSPSAR
jgi:class 3 adenylate cyclase